MDPSLYKDVTTSRGLTYHYWAFRAEGPKPTLLLCHGFPSTSRDWRFIVPFFIEEGYGIVAPDMLGYGGTDKPEEPAAYRGSALIEDLVDILDAEGVDRAVIIGHDWGNFPASRFASYHPERALGYAYFAGSYVPPRGAFDLQAFLDGTKAISGRDLFGYWAFFGADPDAGEIITEHIDSFISQWFPRDPEVWKDYIAPVGAHKKSLLEDLKVPLASYMTEDDVKYFKEVFTKGGWNGPLNWYRAMVQGYQAADDARIPPERAFPPIDSPIFFGATTKDYICTPAFGYATVRSEAMKDHRIICKDFDSDHWLLFTHPEEVARELILWIDGFTQGGKSKAA